MVNLKAAFTKSLEHSELIGNPKFQRSGKEMHDYALHRAYRISTDFDTEVRKIKEEFLHAGYPRHFIENTIAYFKENIQDDILIQPYFFDFRTKVSIRLPYCLLMGKQSRKFIAKINGFTCYKFSFVMENKENKMPARH